MRTTEDFDPRFFAAASVDPLTGTGETYVGMSFNSKYDGKEGTARYGRPVLNLVVALDISGSMAIPFPADETTTGATRQTKLQVAREALAAMGQQLRPDDNFGLVVFNQTASAVMPLRRWGAGEAGTASATLDSAIKSLRASGGTNISGAMTMATRMFEKESGERSNRIVVFTDLEVDQTDGEKFVAQVSENATRCVWSTVVGVGLDLSSEVITKVSKTVGANYSCVRSPENFKELAAAEFAFWVTPVAFAIDVTMESATHVIAEGFGTPEVRDLVKGSDRPIRFSTEFPSSQNDAGETRAGIVLFRLDRKAAATGHGPSESKPPTATMHISWENASGVKSTKQVVLELEGEASPVMRKAILLVRYARFAHDYFALRNLEDHSLLDRFLQLRK
jgi:Mg-chelatase subunit ChlD